MPCVTIGSGSRSASPAWPSRPARRPAAEAARKGPEAAQSARDARALAAKIDRLLAAKWAEARVAPVGPADDAEYLRRVCLDLVGKIPTAAEAREFLDDPAPDKRAKLVERLLDSPAYTARATELWRQLLLPEADTEGQARFAAPAFEAWLRKKVAEEAGYDKIVREILTARLGGPATPARPAPGPSPRPPASSSPRRGSRRTSPPGTSRVFLGIRLECAQCHNHPFAKWKREEFWGLAAFFAGVQKQGPDDGFGAIREVANRRELAIPGTEKIVKAAFLDGSAAGLEGQGRAPRGPGRLGHLAQEPVLRPGRRQPGLGPLLRHRPGRPGRRHGRRQRPLAPRAARRAGRPVRRPTTTS